MLNVPTNLVSGDRWEWRSSDLMYGSTPVLPDHGTLEFSFRSAAGNFDVTAGEVGTEFVTVLGAVQTATIAPGNYRWQAYLTPTGGQRLTVGDGRVQVKPNLAAATTYDDRSEAEKLLELVNKAIASALNNGGKPTQEYEILGRRAKYYDLEQLEALRQQYQAEVNKEERARMGRDRNRKYARFVRG